ncbi:ferredoxin--NADP reductase [Larkinella terrae]|uniref:2Fe-2S iron-sulfur cluster binding domain-containing protein n=1 Tax=Larkinella terrae TaxID=2025311 RepID=A0A7K0EF73_9BACT|nr:ferredoxin--NADP reductase [Larkinella terrae]MRS60499.1 2Fe-2S iron-sulfur cluster binding domain-containing protein [Larkinella terrae]
MANRYFLKVKEVVRQTPDAVTIHFWHPLNEVIRYQPGQYLTFILPFEGQKVRRSYSMSSSPHTDVSLAVTVKRLPGGAVSNYLCDTAKIGDTYETLEPLGTFVPKLDPKNQRRVILIGAGSGITPLISMIKSILHVEPQTQLWLLYGNRNRSSILFENELNELARQSGGRFRITHMLSQPEADWSGLEGRLNQSAILKLLEELPIDDTRRTEFYICGPDGLMDEARSALKLLNVPTDQVHKESFATSPHEAHGVVVDEEPTTMSSPEVTVLYEGSEYKFTVEPHQTILEAALELDIDLPYSCQAGMCTACMGRCLSGKVHLDEEDGLAESELQAGYILTCVAHPLTNDVVIEIE